MDYRAALELARTAARLGSDDLETQTGCVVLDADGNVAAIGWNRLPPGVEPIRERRVRPGKYAWMVHAERHALTTARKCLRGHVMVLPWFPCSDCADRIRLAGLARLVCFAPDFADPRWGEEFRRAEWILRAGSVDLQFFDNAEVS
jgi:dCMP deaminase